VVIARARHPSKCVSLLFVHPQMFLERKWSRSRCSTAFSEPVTNSWRSLASGRMENLIGVSLFSVFAKCDCHSAPSQSESHFVRYGGRLIQLYDCHGFGYVGRESSTASSRTS